MQTDCAKLPKAEQVFFLAAMLLFDLGFSSKVLNLTDRNYAVFYNDFIACFYLADINFVYAGDFADDGADCYDGFAFFIYHACWSDSVFLHAVECVAADCGAFALGEHEDFALDALTVQLVSFLYYDTCVWVNSAVERNRHLRNKRFSLSFAFEDYSAF